MYDQIRKVIKNNGLKIKLYIIQCDKHKLNAKMDFFSRNPKYDTDNLSDNIEDSKFSPYDVCNNVEIDQIYNELETSLYIEYSCLVVLINTLCKCRSRNIIKSVFEKIKANKNLRYKSKLVMSMYWAKSERKAYSANKHSVSTAFFRRSLMDFPHESIFLHPKISDIKHRKKPSKDYFESITKDTLKSVKDILSFKEIYPQNTVFLQAYIHKEFDIGVELETILYQVYESPLRAMQLVLLNNIIILNDFRVLSVSSNADFYFYSINPALAIIINQYYFTKHSAREGSDEDVLHLIRELKIAHIPYILVENCSKKQLLELLNYLKGKNFQPVTKLLFFMMSHGSSSNEIFSSDGDININDIVDTIQSNTSLQNAAKIASFTNCRGNFDIFDGDFDELDDVNNLPPTDNSRLNKNTVLLFSVPDQAKSFRLPSKGSPFIMSFCKHFRTIYHNDSILYLMQKVNEVLKNTVFYDGFTKDGAELVSKYPPEDFNIIPLPIVATDMIRLVQSIVNDTQQLFEAMMENDNSSKNARSDPALKTTFHISGYVNPIVQKYFNNHLNYDHCDLVEKFESVEIGKLADYINN